MLFGSRIAYSFIEILTVWVIILLNMESKVNSLISIIIKLNSVCCICLKFNIAVTSLNIPFLITGLCYIYRDTVFIFGDSCSSTVFIYPAAPVFSIFTEIWLSLCIAVIIWFFVIIIVAVICIRTASIYLDKWKITDSNCAWFHTLTTTVTAIPL